MEYLNQIGELAKGASTSLRKLKTAEKNKILIQIAHAIKDNTKKIIEHNLIDLENAVNNNMKKSFIDRLTLNEDRINQIKDMFIQIASLEDPIGEFTSMKTLPNGLIVGNKRVTIGVVGMIYESRPNVTCDAFALCFKTNNVVILRGGKEAINTNKILVDIFKSVLLKNNLDINFVTLIEDLSRETTTSFMKLNKYVDVLVPRGSASLINSVIENSNIPVIETGVGNCHIFVDESANIDMAENIILNAKVQRPGVCNAAETLLFHKNVLDEHKIKILKSLQSKDVLIKASQKVLDIYKDNIVLATKEDFETEFADLIIAVDIVDNIEDAINFISKYSSNHSEAIITEDYSNSQRFLEEIDSAAVYVNASTRFTDGYEFGFGSELGISTQKLHARGPMGLKVLTTTKYIIFGTGQIRK